MLTCFVCLVRALGFGLQGKAMDKGAVSLQQPYIRVVSIMQEAGDAHSMFKFRCGLWHVARASMCSVLPPLHRATP